MGRLIRPLLLFAFGVAVGVDWRHSDPTVLWHVGVMSLQFVLIVAVALWPSRAPA